MKAIKHPAPIQPPAPQKKPPALSVSVMLTDAEVEQLRKNKRALSDYARKAFAAKK